MDQEVVDNKITKNLAHSNQISAIELPSLNIVTNLSSQDLEYIENEVIPYSIFKHLENRFSDFSEEWHEITEEGIINKTAKSSKVLFRFFHLKSINANFKNKLITNIYQSKDTYKIKAHEYRNEVIITDGEVFKSEKNEIKSVDNCFIETHQEIEIFNASYLVTLNREKKTTPFGKWEHHDEIHFFMMDRIKLDYLRMYIGSKF